MDKFSLGFGIGIIGIICLYFFWFVPETNKSYERGLKEGKGQLDTIYIKGETVIEHDTVNLSTTKEVPVKIEGDAERKTVVSEFDSSFVSHNDVIGVKAKVSIKDSSAKWLVDINHFNTREIQIDTFKIKVPQIIEKAKISWGWNLVTFLGGILTAVLIFIIGQ